MRDIRIKIARRKDFRKIAEIYKEGFSEEPYNENWTLKEAKKKIKLFSKYCDIWKAEENKEIIGYLVINANHWKPGEIIFGEDIGVKKEYRRNYVATVLLKSIWIYYSKKGYKKFMGIINKKAKSFGFIKKLELDISKENILVEKDIK